MNRSLPILIESLKRFDSTASPEWHDSLEIKLPEGLFRYKSVVQSPYPSWDTMDVSLTYYFKTLNFSVRISEKSAIAFVSILEVSKDDPDKQEKIRRYLIEDDIRLSIIDTRKLFFYLQRNYSPFTISVITKS